MDDSMNYCIDSTTSSDTITISSIGANTITLPPSSAYSTTIPYNVSSNNFTFNTNGNSNVNISETGINIKEGGDIKVGNRSLSEFMKTIENRLAILVPDPDKLDQFEALKKAYDHYKTLESLCFPSNNTK